MKPFLLSLCLSLLFALPATTLQAQSARTALEFNDQLTTITDSLYAYGQRWGRQYNEINKSRAKEVHNPMTFSSLKPYRQSMELFVDRSITQLKAMEDVKNSKDLRVAMIGFMEYEKKMVTLAFKPIEQLKPTATTGELQTVLEQLKTYSKAENAELQKVAAAQEAYAKSNGFAIESAEEAEKP